MHARQFVVLGPVHILHAGLQWRHILVVLSPYRLNVPLGSQLLTHEVSLKNVPTLHDRHSDLDLLESQVLQF